MDLRNIDIYDMAINHWGMQKQMTKAVEELAELTKEICKIQLDDGPEITTKNLVEEIADVRIMLEQLEWMFQIFTEVEETIQYKLDRTKQRIEKEINEG